MCWKLCAENVYETTVQLKSLWSRPWFDNFYPPISGLKSGQKFPVLWSGTELSDGFLIIFSLSKAKVVLKKGSFQTCHTHPSSPITINPLSMIFSSQYIFENPLTFSTVWKWIEDLYFDHHVCACTKCSICLAKGLSFYVASPKIITKYLASDIWLFSLWFAYLLLVYSAPHLGIITCT